MQLLKWLVTVAQYCTFGEKQGKRHALVDEQARQHEQVVDTPLPNVDSTQERICGCLKFPLKVGDKWDFKATMEKGMRWGGRSNSMEMTNQLTSLVAIMRKEFSVYIHDVNVPSHLQTILNKTVRPKHGCTSRKPTLSPSGCASYPSCNKLNYGYAMEECATKKIAALATKDFSKATSFFIPFKTWELRWLLQNRSVGGRY